MFINSWCAKSLGVKSNGRKIKSVSITSGAASLTLCVWKALYNVEERGHLWASGWSLLGGSPGLLASSSLGPGFPFRSLHFFLSMLITHG